MEISFDFQIEFDDRAAHRHQSTFNILSTHVFQALDLYSLCDVGHGVSAMTMCRCEIVRQVESDGGRSAGGGDTLGNNDND